MTDELSEIAKGADSAVWAFLIDREYSIKDRFEVGAEKAFTAWMTGHGAEIIEGLRVMFSNYLVQHIDPGDFTTADAQRAIDPGPLRIAYDLVPEGQRCSTCGDPVPARLRHPDLVLLDASDQRVCMGCARNNHEGYYEAVNTLRHVEEAFANLMPEPGSESGPAWDYLRAVAQGADLLLAHEQF